MILEILNFILHKNTTFIIHILNIFTLFLLLCLFVFTKKHYKRIDKINDYFGIIAKTVNSVRYGDLTKKIKKIDIPNSQNLTDSINRMIETLNDREKMIVEYQSELQKQNNFLEAIINSLSDGLIIINENYEILRATPQIKKWFNLAGNDIYGKNILDFIKLPKNKKIENLSDDEVFLCKNQDLSFTASCMKLNLDELNYVILIKNITTQREIDTLKEDFVATLTHDLKVPIIAEKNVLELFINQSFGEINEKQAFALKNMQSSNNELLDLVQTILDTYKIKEGKINLYKENITLCNFIKEIMVEMSAIAEKNNNNIVFNPQRDICVYADRIQLKRVMKNLIQNAISYGEKNSPIEISIGEIPRYIVIKVKDYGAGISKNDIEKIFNKYYSAAKKFRKIGTGLGLYFSLQVIKAHEGELLVDSELGKYTEFTIKLPAIMNKNLHYGE